MSEEIDTACSVKIMPWKQNLSYTWGFFPQEWWAILLSCCLNSVIASLRGLPDQNKIVIGEVYTQGSGDSIDYNITIVSFVFHPLENTGPLF